MDFYEVYSRQSLHTTLAMINFLSRKHSRWWLTFSRFSFIISSALLQKLYWNSI